ncbi:MAG: EthD family reductase [Desulfobacterales bacterium]|nr:MAG: EthD family reductase [Desulfobacterales bacterium]
MIKVSVFYPNNEGSKFDMGYYCNSHIPMVKQKLGAALKGVFVEQGLGGPEPGSRATYIAMGHLLFDSVEAFQAAFGPHAQAIMGDVPNYTDTQPTVQISEVKI